MALINLKDESLLLSGQMRYLFTRYSGTSIIWAAWDSRVPI